MANEFHLFADFFWAVSAFYAAGFLVDLIVILAVAAVLVTFTVLRVLLSEREKPLCQIPEIPLPTDAVAKATIAGAIGNALSAGVMVTGALVLGSFNNADIGPHTPLSSAFAAGLAYFICTGLLKSLLNRRFKIYATRPVRRIFTRFSTIAWLVMIGILIAIALVVDILPEYFILGVQPPFWAWIILIVGIGDLIYWLERWHANRTIPPPLETPQ